MRAYLERSGLGGMDRMSHWIVDQSVERARREDGRDWDRYNGGIIHTYRYIYIDSTYISASA